MPSASLEFWRNDCAKALDEIEGAHKSVGGSGRGRRYATQQINYAYTMLLSSQFQAFCRVLHSECANYMVEGVGSAPLKVAFRNALVQNRKLDRGNPTSGNLGADFKIFGLKFWEAVKSLDIRNEERKNLLDDLNTWRNAIAHQDFMKIGGSRTLHLRYVKAWRASCNQLASAFDEVMRQHLHTITGTTPW